MSTPCASPCALKLSHRALTPVNRSLSHSFRPSSPVAISADRPWNARGNGLSIKRTEERTGYFGSINLLGPRAASQSNYWRSTVTATQLRFEFRYERYPDFYKFFGLEGLRPLTIGRTYISFFDLDAGLGAGEDGLAQVEAVQFGPQVFPPPCPCTYMPMAICPCQTSSAGAGCKRRAGSGH